MGRKPGMRWVRLVLVLGLLLGFSATRAEGQAQAPPDRPDPSVAPRLSSGATPAASPAAPATDDGPAWVATVQPTDLWSDPGGGGSFGQVPQGSYFQLTGQDATGRLYVLNPRTQNYAWVDAAAVGPVPAPTDDSYLRDPAPAPAVAATPGAPPDAASAQWVANFRPADLWSDSDGGRTFGTARQWSYFALTGQADNDRLYVFNPRTQNYAWVDADAVGPSSTPPDWYLKQPELLYSVGKPGRVVGGFNLRSWPTVRDDTRLRQLGHNAAVFVEEAV